MRFVLSSFSSFSGVRNLVLFALLLLAGPASAQTGCVPNPNNNGPPFVDGCPLSATGLNLGFSQINTNSAFVPKSSYVQGKILAGTGPGAFQARYENNGANILDFGPAGTVCSGGDDTVPALAALATGQSMFLPAASCKINTFSYGLPHTNAQGTGYKPNDTITLNNGSIVTVANVTLVSISNNAAGSGYSAGDNITLVGGVFSGSGQAIVNVTSVNGSGAITGFALQNGGFYTTNPLSFTSSGGTGSGATWTVAASGWGVGNPVWAALPVTSTPANPATQAATSGSGSGATFNELYYGLPLTVDGQCILGNGQDNTTLTTSTTAIRGLVVTFGNNNCIERMSITMPSAPDGWAIGLDSPAGAASVDDVHIFNIPGAIFMVNPGRNARLNDIDIGKQSGGTMSLVFSTGGSNLASIFCAGDFSAGNAGPVVARSIFWSGAANPNPNVNSLVLDGNCNSGDWFTLRPTNTYRALWMRDTSNVSAGQAMKHPAFAWFYDLSAQTQSATDAAIKIDSGQSARFYSLFANAAQGDCVYIGPNTNNTAIYGSDVNTCANNGYEILGDNVLIDGGQILNANKIPGDGSNGCSSCANVRVGSGGNAIINNIYTMGGAFTGYDINALSGAVSVMATNDVFSATTPINDPGNVVATWPAVWLAFTPTPTFATPGNQNFSCGGQGGWWWNEGSTVHYQVHLLNCTVTYTTASGNFFVGLTGLPNSVGGGQSDYSASISRWGMFTLDSGFTDLNAQINPTTNQVQFYENGSTKNSTQISVTQLPTASVFTLNLSGSYQASYP